MTAPAHYAGLLAAVVAVSTGCHRSALPQSSPSADWWASTNLPVLALWDGGSSMIGKPPSAIFAVWADGMIVRSIDGRLQRGQVSSQEIHKLMNEVEAAGFFSPPLAYGLTRPDGPVRCLAAMRNGQ